MLALEIVSTHAASMGAQSRRVIGASGLRIGRDSDNDWVFPQSYVSRKQAVIRCVNGMYFLEQLGNCPLAINEPNRPVEKNRIVRLSSGDRIWIDDIELRAIEVELADLPPAPPVSTPAPLSAGAIVPSASYQQALGGKVDPLDILASDVGAAPLQHSPSPAIPDIGSVLDFAIEMPAGQPPASPGGSGIGLRDDWMSPAPTPMPESRPHSDRAELPPASTLGAAPVVEHAVRASTTEDAQLQLKELLRAAGLDPGREPLPPETVQQFGSILRIVVEGTMQVLQARNEIKREFRLPTTQVAQRGNNPLKFSADASDVLHKLLVQRSTAYLDPVAAFTDAFDDIRHHQLAMLSSLRVAFDHLLAQFAPEYLEEQFSKGARAGMLGIGAKGRPWESYALRYKELLADQDFAFRRLFGDEFAKAYEHELERHRQLGRAGKARRRE